MKKVNIKKDVLLHKTPDFNLLIEFKKSVYSVNPLYYQYIEFPKIEPLPTIQVAREMTKLAATLDLKSQPSHRLVGTGYTIMLGEKVFTLSCERPYQGWACFQGKIQALLKVLEQTEAIKAVERFSLKYINILPSLTQPELDMLKFKAELGPYNLTNHHCLIMTQFYQDDFLNIIHVIPQAPVSIVFQKNNVTKRMLSLLRDSIR